MQLELQLLTWQVLSISFVLGLIVSVLLKTPVIAYSISLPISLFMPFLSSFDGMVLVGLVPAYMLISVFATWSSYFFQSARKNDDTNLK